MPVEQVFQKHIVDGASHFFKNTINLPDFEYGLRYDLAQRLGISINDVIIVGSAKVGFSVKTEAFSPFDSKFIETGLEREKSDIDVAIVNRNLFDSINREIYGLSRHFDADWIAQKWKMNYFNTTPSDLHKRYAVFLAKGWLRPDLMPLDYYRSAAWVPVVEHWREKLEKRKIALGFYSDWYYLKHYQMDNLNRLRAKLMTLEV
ncbi:hypothetical protein O3297_16725 [Janthinobacterium sp. SUN128]|uniref:hypothetical protein n=1 Tax=Janthinobacterium sp. SUN128 TaxID=3014790 RepID=UPI0027124C0E|nr:hypothetical protein [Janthinobacterium sp. SUN128]MDO8035060.1 hypothetical protein [Janthinobacterium sp. SUN128]